MAYLNAISVLDNFAQKIRSNVLKYLEETDSKEYTKATLRGINSDKENIANIIYSFVQSSITLNVDIAYSEVEVEILIKYLGVVLNKLMTMVFKTDIIIAKSFSNSIYGFNYVLKPYKLEDFLELEPPNILVLGKMRVARDVLYGESVCSIFIDTISQNT